MENDKSTTPSDSDNKLGLTDYAEINRVEARGVLKAHMALVFEVDLDEPVRADQLLKLHRIAFEELYDWAGKFRSTTPLVGTLHLPPPGQVPWQLYQLLEDINFRSQQIEDHTSLVELLSFSHVRLTQIHPFTNGNGRTARILTNWLAYKNGYGDVDLYSAAGRKREVYIAALREADKFNFNQLNDLIQKSLKPLR